MIQTINQNQVIIELRNISQKIDAILSSESKKDYPEVVKEEKELNLLLANRNAYRKMLLKTVKHPIHSIDII